MFSCFSPNTPNFKIDRFPKLKCDVGGGTCKMPPRRKSMKKSRKGFCQLNEDDINNFLLQMSDQLPHGATKFQKRLKVQHDSARNCHNNKCTNTFSFSSEDALMNENRCRSERHGGGHDEKVQQEKVEESCAEFLSIVQDAVTETVQNCIKSALKESLSKIIKKVDSLCKQTAHNTCCMEDLSKDLTKQMDNMNLKNDVRFKCLCEFLFENIAGQKIASGASLNDFKETNETEDGLYEASVKSSKSGKCSEGSESALPERNSTSQNGKPVRDPSEQNIASPRTSKDQGRPDLNERLRLLKLSRGSCEQQTRESKTDEFRTSGNSPHEQIPQDCSGSGENLATPNETPAENINAKSMCRCSKKNANGRRTFTGKITDVQKEDPPRKCTCPKRGKDETNNSPSNCRCSTEHEPYPTPELKKSCDNSECRKSKNGESDREDSRSSISRSIKFNAVVKSCCQRHNESPPNAKKFCTCPNFEKDQNQRSAGGAAISPYVPQPKPSSENVKKKTVFPGEICLDPTDHFLRMCVMERLERQKRLTSLETRA